MDFNQSKYPLRLWRGDLRWSLMEMLKSIKARLKVAVKRIVRKFGYPPDKQLLAIETILKLAELIANDR